MQNKLGKLFYNKQNTAATFEKTKLDLRKVMLLDSESTMDLFCNKELVEDINKSDKLLRLKSNGGRMVVKQKATVPGYKFKVWFSETAITNILSLKNVIKQYRVSYESNRESFIVHRQEHGLPDMNSKCIHQDCITTTQQKTTIRFL